MNWIEKLRTHGRRSRLKAYLARVRGLLGRQYGKSESYNPDQVVSVIEADALPVDDILYVLALLSTQDDYEAFISTRGEKLGYWQVRTEIAHWFFQDNACFTRQDVSILVTPVAREDFEDGIPRYPYSS
jgi:hypothetical protein